MARSQLQRCLKIVLAVYAASLWSVAGAAEPDLRRDATVEAVRRVMPCVVNVGTENVVESRDSFEDIFRQFFYPYHQRQRNQFSLGSGVIIDEDGYILTNLHVVQRARRIQIKLAEEVGGGEYEVEPIIGTTKTDVALLKIIPKTPGEKFNAVRFAKDDDLLVGETVLALGNPFGLGGSVSRGILSSKRRAAPKDNEPLDVPNWLQTDASINPGNSGGPLVNLNGDLIGLNVAVSAQGQGIGFAIPIKQVSEALAEIFTPETDARWFGARISPASSPLTITEVKSGSPADKAGLRTGDQILKVNGNAPKGFIELNQWLRDNSRTDFMFTVQRGAQQQTAKVSLVPLEQMIRQKIGLDTQELRGNLAQSFGLSPSTGLLVAGVEKGSPADQARITTGAVVTEINGKRVPDFLNAMELFSNLKKGDAVRLVVLVPQRQGNYLIGYREGAVSIKAR